LLRLKRDCILRKNVGHEPRAPNRRQQERYYERAVTVMRLVVVHGGNAHINWLLAEELSELLVGTLPRFLTLK
jgi:hypothetical protein